MNKLKSLLAVCCMAAVGSVDAQTLTLNLDKAGRTVSPTLYGLMTEEINYAYEGGLYTQLLRDPTMRELQEMGRGQGQRPRVRTAPKPRSWVPTDTLCSSCRIANRQMPVRKTTLNIAPETVRHNSLVIETTKDGEGVINKGFWGIAAAPNTKYIGSFFIHTPGDVTVGLKSAKDDKVLAQQTIAVSGDSWQQKDFTLQVGDAISETTNAVFFITFAKAGKYEISYTTLFPASKYGTKFAGLRDDLMDMMTAMHPTFLRFPGGNYLEGNRFSERFNWKNTVGPLSERPGHQCPWGYWSTDGMGLLEFLTWTEKIGAEPILGVFAGYVLQGDYVEGEALEPFIKDALDEIEYVIGGPQTKWGAQRVKDGHPEPFKLQYVEIGNEDFFDRSGSYSRRFQQFYEAIKAKYPQLQIISTIDEKALRAGSDDPANLKVDMIDEHYYRNTEGMYKAAWQYDSYDRNGPKIFCGEWASREGGPTTNLNAALGDAAWMTCMERNSDILVASCYAPLFVNVSQDGGQKKYPGMQWESDLIGYDAFSAYGSPSYYAQCMFAGNLGDKVVPITAADIPDMHYGNGELPQLYYVATRDTQSGTVYLKIVNGGGTAVKVRLSAQGGKLRTSKSELISLKSAKPDDTNTIDNPKNIVPQTSKCKIKNGGTITVAPYSINVYVIK